MASSDEDLKATAIGELKPCEIQPDGDPGLGELLEPSLQQATRREVQLPRPPSAIGQRPG